MTDEAGGTKRLSLTVTLAERERQLSIARDEENMWLVQDHPGESKRAAYDGALDVDVIFSPFFNALPIRRTGIYQRTESVAVPVVYVRLPDLSVDAATISYSSAGPISRPGSSCIRRSPRPRSPSTPTGSSSTIQGWQSGSDHPARAPGGGEFLAPVVRADDDGDDLRPGEAVVAHPRGVPGLDEIGHRPVAASASRALVSSSMVRSSAGKQLLRSSPRTWPAPGPARWPPPGCRRGRIPRPARTPAAPRPR